MSGNHVRFSRNGARFLQGRVSVKEQLSAEGNERKITNNLASWQGGTERVYPLQITYLPNFTGGREGVT